MGCDHHHLCGYYSVLYCCGQVVRFDDCHTCGCMFDWWSVVEFDTCGGMLDLQSSCVHLSSLYLLLCV